MPKLAKLAYGISEDGLYIKLAALIRDGTQIYLQSLDQVELEHSLYTHATDIKIDADSQLDAWNTESKPTEEISLDDFSQDNVSSFQINPYEGMFRNHPLNQGVLAININDENIIRLPVNSHSLKTRQQAKIVKENLSHKEYKKGNWQSSIIAINDQPELWLHTGPNRLLEILDGYQKNLKHKFYYQLADANEAALASLFMLNHTAEDTESSLVLYLGMEYRRALLFEGNKLTLSLPIQVAQHSPDIETLYSKLSLALDEAHVSDPKRLYVCGDICSEDALGYLRSQLPNTDVGLWQLVNLEIDHTATQRYSANQIARYILPIALAWKALVFDNPTIIHSNFLPAAVIEGQKVFKIAWHGYLTFGLIFVVSLYLTNSFLHQNLELKQTKAKNKALQLETLRKKNQAEQVLAMAKAIDTQKANIEVIKTLLVDKNPWTEIITTLDNGFNSHPTSWIKNIQKKEAGILLTGVTTKRSNVVFFSGLLPSGKINKVTHQKIRSNSLWEFEIAYKYPTVNWYEIMEKDMQKLKEYEERKALRETRDNPAQGVSNQILTSDQTNPAKDKKNLKNTLTQGAEKLKNTLTSKTDPSKTTTVKAGMDFPIPPKNLTKDKEDPSVQAYDKFYTAFSEKQTWLMIDVGVKFLNNYPKSPLNSYVRWYLSYQNWSEKQYSRPTQWLEPLLRKPDAIYPNVLLLIGHIYRDSGDQKKGEDMWRMIIQDYPTHPVAKTARILLGIKS